MVIDNQRRPQARRIECTASGFSNDFSDLMLGFRIKGGLCLLVGPVRTYGKSADQALIICQALVQNDHALRRDFIFPDILGVIATAHLDHHHDLAKLPIDGYIPQPDDVIAKERN
jgi:hypothetical protein